MLITNKLELQKYTAEHRLWQGIPGIEVTEKGRLFSTFYSGGINEGPLNFVVVEISDDDGKSFSDPIAVAFKKEGRCYDPVLWIDPAGRLWFTWAYASEQEESGVFGAICEDPDADTLSWSDVFFIGKYVMMNKPTVLSTGEWLFPIAVWDPKIKMFGLPPEDYGHREEETGAFVYRSVDHQTAFRRLGGVVAPRRTFDEHMVIELRNGGLMMLIRTEYGIGVSYSYDGGSTWTPAEKTKLGGPNSRFFIRRLRSGRMLLINHYQHRDRDHLTALLSDDDGKTWSHSLLLDERANVSYPDAVEAANGSIYVTYDRERGAGRRNLEACRNDAREILFAKITEEDILAGELISPDSRLKCVISKLGDYVDDANPYRELGRLNEIELAEVLCKEEADKKACRAAIFDCYPVACENMCRSELKRLDALFAEVDRREEDRFPIMLEIVRLVRSVSVDGKEQMPLIERVKQILCDGIRENLSVSQVADRLGVSESYLMHAFKKQTGLTVGDYKAVLRISRAKLLLLGSEKSMAEIAELCGFESLQYFSSCFKAATELSPSAYRELRTQKG